MRRLLLCADDFALSSPISETIVELAVAGKINAISCMSASPNWSVDSQLLTRVPATVEIGLHLVLTSETPITSMPLLAPAGQLPGIDRLTWDAWRGRLPTAEIAAEIAVQFDRFREVSGKDPDFVDGHQNSHILPGIRHSVIAATKSYAPHAWMRDCSDRFGAMMARPFRGKAIASAAKSSGFAQAVAAQGLRCNIGFAGHYGFAGDYSLVFERFLHSPGPMHLIMCHPGAGTLSQDSIAHARINEAKALRMLPIRDMAESYGLAFTS